MFRDALSRLHKVFAVKDKTLIECGKIAKEQREKTKKIFYLNQRKTRESLQMPLPVDV